MEVEEGEKMEKMGVGKEETSIRTNTNVRMLAEQMNWTKALSQAHHSAEMIGW